MNNSAVNIQKLTLFCSFFLYLPTYKHTICCVDKVKFTVISELLTKYLRLQKLLSDTQYCLSPQMDQKPHS